MPPTGNVAIHDHEVDSILGNRRMNFTKKTTSKSEGRNEILVEKHGQSETTSESYKTDCIFHF